MSPVSDREQSLQPLGADVDLDEWDSTPSITRHGRLRLELERARDGARITLEVAQSAAGLDSLHATPLGDVSYSKTSGISGVDAAKVVRRFGAALEAGALEQVSTSLPHLMIGPDGRAADGVATRLLDTVMRQNVPLLAAPDEVLEPERQPTELFFDPPGLAAFLEPELRIDGEPLQGFTLRTIAYPSVVAGGDQSFDVCVLEFERDGRLTRIRVGTHEAFETPFGRTPNLALYVEPDRSAHGELLAAEVGSLASLVVAVLAAKDATTLALRVPANADEVRAYSVPTRASDAPAAARESKRPPRPGRSLNLAIDAECNQACAFCSVKWVIQPEDGGDERLERALRDLRRAREDGVEIVRLNGIDPLNFSRVLDVVREVRDLGFARLDVYSTSRRFADADFARAFADAAPRDVSVSLPVYGVTAEVHETVTGAPGSFDEVMAAVANLRAHFGRARLRISTVAVKANVEQFPEIAAFAARHGALFDPHMPYPMRESTRDPYCDSVARESDIVASVLARPELDSKLQGALAQLIPHPCVLWHARPPGRRIALLRVAAGDGPKYLDGTEYASAEFVHGGGQSTSENVFSPRVIPCPRRRGCALAGDCPAEFIAQYVEVYGMDEFQPVAFPDLVKQLNLPELVGSLVDRTVGGSPLDPKRIGVAVGVVVAIVAAVVALLLRQ